MNPIQITTAIAGAAVVGVAIVKHSKIVKTERQKRKEIQLNLEKDLEAVRLSSEMVKRKIEKGDYDRTFNIAAILSDMRFYQMTARFED